MWLLPKFLQTSFWKCERRSCSICHLTGCWKPKPPVKNTKRHANMHVKAPAAQRRKIWIKRQNENYLSQCFHRQRHGGVSWAVGLRRRSVIETRAEQCEKVTAQKDYSNSNINAIKCARAGVCRSSLHRLIVTQHGESRMWGRDDDRTTLEAGGCCKSSKNVCLLGGLYVNAQDGRFITEWGKDSTFPRRFSRWFHALATAAPLARQRPAPDLSSRLHSGAVLLTGLSPFITVFHYCTKSR